MADISSTGFTPAPARRPDRSAALPAASAPDSATQPIASADRLSLSGRVDLTGKALGQARERAIADAEAERILASMATPDAAAGDDASPAIALPTRVKPGFSIESVRFADLGANGRETTVNRDEDPEQASAAAARIQKDPQSGQANLALKSASFRVAAGDYDLFWSVGADGTPRFDRLEKDGQNVQGLLTQALKAKIAERPGLYKPLAGVAVAGAVLAAHRYAAKSGKSIPFEALNVKLYGDEHTEIRAQLEAELTGEKRFVRASSARVSAAYHDERLEVVGAARYMLRSPEHPTDAWELSSGVTYAVSPRTTLVGNAFVNTRDHNHGAFIGLTSRF